MRMVQKTNKHISGRSAGEIAMLIRQVGNAKKDYCNATNPIILHNTLNLEKNGVTTVADHTEFHSCQSILEIRSLYWAHRSKQQC